MSDDYMHKDVESNEIFSDAIRERKELVALREKNKPTEEEYRQAIKKLLWVTSLGTGGSYPAAMVLLSAYSSSSFQVQIDSLGALDVKCFDAAMTVIRGRIERAEEPHNLIENGSAIFQALAEDYSRFNRLID